MPEPQQIAARIRKWEKNGPQGPMTLEIYPTLKCNLNCGFCDTTERHQKPVNELSLARHLALLEEAAEMGVQRAFVLGGGEPLLAKEKTPAILKRIKELGMEGILTTNGTLMGPDLREDLLEWGWDEIHFSVDGPTPEIHDALRGVQGAFKKTVSAICALNVLKKTRGLAHPKIALHFVLTNLNYTHLSDMLRLAAAVGAFRVDFDALIAYREEQKAFDLSPAQKAEVPAIALEAIELADKLGIQTTLKGFLDTENLSRGERTIPVPQVLGDAQNSGLNDALRKAPCLKAWHYLVVQADGRTSPCCVLAGEGESLANTPLKTLWEKSPFLEKVREGMLNGEPLPRCRECSGNILAHEAVIRSHL
jgi:MoaA/NifB/PqqE/SkfB family radical SAM enzyme